MSAAATSLCGEYHVFETARLYQDKSKNAQEAIRPVGDAFKTPGELTPELSCDEFAA
jgi:DNA topoisomerase-1